VGVQGEIGSSRILVVILKKATAKKGLVDSRLSQRAQNRPAKAVKSTCVS
jgi:hypothetical protein